MLLSLKKKKPLLFEVLEEERGGSREVVEEELHVHQERSQSLIARLSVFAV
jgi:hypothetical protein